MSEPAFRIDLHVHSRLSGDNEADPEECVVRAIEAGLQGIAFTEHYSFAASEPIEALRERYRDEILVVRGVEFSADEGHCLVFGVDPDSLVLPYAPMREVVLAVNRAGGAAVPAHPYRVGSGVGEGIRSLPGVAAIEGRNGCNLDAFNQRALAAARELGLPVTGGSDAHAAREVGACFTLFRSRVTRENLAARLREGGYEAVDTRRISRGWGA